MTRPNLRYLSNQSVEDITTQRIRQYETATKATVRFPVPAEEIIEQVLKLSILWDYIEEQPGELILGGLQRKAATIVLNEKYLELFEQKPGLLRSTQVHEAGHADLEGGLKDQVASL